MARLIAMLVPVLSIRHGCLAARSVAPPNSQPIPHAVVGSFAVHLRQTERRQTWSQDEELARQEGTQDRKGMWRDEGRRSERSREEMRRE
eukprot:760226-Hanusia_phi.AAC.4